MKTVKFYKIPNTIKELVFDGDKEDKRLFYDGDIRWYKKKRKKYEKIEKELDDYEIDRQYWTVYVSYDVSGFDYWIKNMNEENYISIVVIFKEDLIPFDELNQLADDIRNTYEHFEKYESYAN